MDLYGVLVQLSLETNVGSNNRPFFTNELDRGLSRHSLLGDEVCADDCGASADAHNAMYQDLALRVLQGISDKGGGVVEVGCNLLPEVV